ncbi:hypothetical protein MBM09_03780 [Flaviramulus sp. BrNp1-15]|uniref:hypothetical protein n=1 Tax=Flaviramulus sp. BrNp1-15 TaxID=2916754 RepID=UPI001EE8F462|nr:hypothetical protein [Flaviramulus sp. BrNp1-15]ULC60111.1 hypothetical protein MBM09_03780 [Flaviramulus sp. BrNp1-15]
MKYEFSIYLSFFFLIFSCSENNEELTSNNTNLPEVTVISSVNNILYQQDVNPNSENVSVTNLTNAFGVETNYLSSNFYNSLVSFYNRFTSDNFILQKNIVTNEYYSNTGLCKEPNEDIMHVTSNYKKIIVFTIEHQLVNGAYQSYMSILDRDSKTCQRVFVGNFIFPSSGGNFYVEDNNILIGFRDDLLDKNKIINIDLNSAQVIASLEFENTYFSSTVTEDKLAILFYQQENKVYNKNTLKPVEDSRFYNLSSTANPYFFKSEIHNNKLYFDVQLAQPSPAAYTPGYIDLSNNELYLLDSYDLMAKYAKIYGYGFNSFDSHTAYPKKNIAVFGFTNNLDEHGLIYTNYEGEILKIIPLEHKVRYILKN